MKRNEIAEGQTVTYRHAGTAYRVTVLAVEPWEMRKAYRESRVRLVNGTEVDTGIYRQGGTNGVLCRLPGAQNAFVAQLRTLSA